MSTSTYNIDFEYFVKFVGDPAVMSLFFLILRYDGFFLLMVFIKVSVNTDIVIKFSVYYDSLKVIFLSTYVLFYYKV